MKKKLQFLLAVILLGVIFCACSTEDQQEREKVEELSQKEIEAINQAFSMTDTAGELRVNPLCFFLTSFYDKPEELNLAAFLRYFPESGRGSEEEFQALKKKEGWPFSDHSTLKDMPVPLHKIQAEEVEAVLQKYSGVSLSRLESLNEPDVFYLEDYDAFYTYTSDFGLESFTCAYGEREGAQIRLYQESWDGAICLLTVYQQDDSFRIFSYQETGRWK